MNQNQQINEHYTTNSQRLLQFTYQNKQLLQKVDDLVEKCLEHKRSLPGGLTGQTKMRMLFNRNSDGKA